jgi:YbbR domain-containing protein
MKILKKIASLVPIVLISLLLSFFVWFSAVNSKDPTEEITYSRPVPIEVLGQNPQYTISDQSANNVTVTIKAPRSVHNSIANDMKLIRASINVSALKDGQAVLEPEISIDVKPAKLTDYNPKTVRLSIEKLVTQNYQINLNQTGNLPMGLEARTTRLDTKEVQITGPESKISEVHEVLATVDMSTVTGNLSKLVDLQAVDEQGNIINGISMSPSKVTVIITIIQKGGYKNAFLALVPLGSPAYGFQITNTEIVPQVVTIYAFNPNETDKLPDLIETNPVNLNGRDESFEEVVTLKLPPGVRLVGDVEVLVKVTIEPTITTKSIRGVPITVNNLSQNLEAVLNVPYVDVYLTGPTHLLANLNAQNLTIALDLTDFDKGTHQVKPVIVLPESAINYLITPEFVEVVIQPK